MISKDEILALAQLAELSVSEQETGELARGLEKMIQFADAVKSAPVDLTACGEKNSGNRFRSDEAAASFPCREILQNAGGGENGFFKVLEK